MRCMYTYLSAYPCNSLSIYVCNIYNPVANTDQNFPLKMYCVCTSAQSLSRVQLFWDPMDCSSPGYSVHGFLQARILEWVAIPFSRGSSWSWVSCIAGRFFTVRATKFEPCRESCGRAPGWGDTTVCNQSRTVTLRTPPWDVIATVILDKLSLRALPGQADS